MDFQVEVTNAKGAQPDFCNALAPVPWRVGDGDCTINRGPAGAVAAPALEGPHPAFSVATCTVLQDRDFQIDAPTKKGLSGGYGNVHDKRGRRLGLGPV